MRPLPPGLPPEVAKHAIKFQQQLMQSIPRGIPPDIAQHAINLKQQQMPTGRSAGGTIVAVVVCLLIGAMMLFKVILPLIGLAILSRVLL